MKVVDLVIFSADLMKRLHEIGIRLDDYKHIEMYREYKVMKADGHKTVFVIAKLSETYKVSERLIYKVLKHFERDCTDDAGV